MTVVRTTQGVNFLTNADYTPVGKHCIDVDQNATGCGE
jgi:hypothetical protein